MKRSYRYVLSLDDQVVSRHNSSQNAYMQGAVLAFRAPRTSSIELLDTTKFPDRVAALVWRASGSGYQSGDDYRGELCALDPKLFARFFLGEDGRAD